MCYHKSSAGRLWNWKGKAVGVTFSTEVHCFSKDECRRPNEGIETDMTMSHFPVSFPRFFSFPCIAWIQRNKKPKSIALFSIGHETRGYSWLLQRLSKYRNCKGRLRSCTGRVQGRTYTEQGYNKFVTDMTIPVPAMLQENHMHTQASSSFCKPILNPSLNRQNSG